MQRARKQSGCLVKRNGWWLIRYRMKIKQNGELRTVNRAHKLCPVDAMHKTKASVRSLQEEFLRPLNERSYVPETNLRLSEFVEKIYLPYTREHKRPSTAKGYADLWKDHVKGRCGEWWLRDIRTVDVQRVLDSVARQDSLNKTSLKHVKHFLSGILRFALQQGFFDRANPVTATSIPDAPSAGETHAYTLEEIEQMIAALPPRAATVVATAALTGLRRGEIRGMLWENFELSKDGTIISYRVSQSIWKGISTEPKTAKSKAPVPVIGSLAKKLEEHRAASGSPETGPVFRNTLGKPLDLNELYRRVMKEIFVAKHIKWHGWHAFRRGLATNLHRLAVSDKLIQAILRHSNVSTTQNIYIKTVSADAVAAMNRLESLLAFSTGSQDGGSTTMAVKPLLN